MLLLVLEWDELLAGEFLHLWLPPLQLHQDLLDLSEEWEALLCNL